MVWFSFIISNFHDNINSEVYKKSTQMYAKLGFNIIFA